MHRESDREQQMVSEGRTEKDYCIGGKLEDALGIKLCGEIAFPTLRPKDGQPWFPFNGPLTAKMFAQKEDTHTGYHMEAKLISVSLICVLKWTYLFRLISGFYGATTVL